MSIIYCGDKKLVRGERTFIMGILNTSEDSFSDGGKYCSLSSAVDHALKLVDQGADIIDIGGVATSPCAKGSVAEDEEVRRVVPVIAALRRHGITAISVDTSRASVAERALDEGAAWINDQHAANDPHMPAVMARAQAAILMHNVGSPGVQAGEHMIYDDVCLQLRSFFAQRIDSLVARGVKRECIIVDPGIGFGKGLKDSLAVLRGINVFAKLAAMTMIGVSRKSFIGAITGITDPQKRDYASLGATAVALEAGAHIVRTHNVQAVFDMVQVFDACRPKEHHCSHENIY